MPSTRRPGSACEHIDEVYQLDGGMDGVLGSSSIGTIIKMRHRKSQKMRAVKQISKRNIEGEGWKEEIHTLQQLDHPHICKLHETWEDARSVYLIMELCKGGSLTNLAEKHPEVNEGMIAALVWQMVSAVGHLHKHNIVHSDINAENWLFGQNEPSEKSEKNSGNGTQDPPSKQNGSEFHRHFIDTSLKMIDYGLANKHGKHTRASARNRPRSWNNGPVRPGTEDVLYQRRLNLREQQYLLCKSPEQMETEDNGHEYGFGGRNGSVHSGYSGSSMSSYHRPHSATQVTDKQGSTAQISHSETKMDVWALGVLAYFLLSGQSPFHGPAKTKDVQIRNARFVFMPSDLWRPVSSEAKHFIALCLQRDPECRPSAEKALSLPWMKLGNRIIEEYTGRGSTNGDAASLRLSLADPALPSAQSILAAMDRMNHLNALEKAGVIATAHHLPFEKLADLPKKLERFDQQREGLLSLQELFEVLVATGVPCQDLLKQVQELDREGMVAADYLEFVQSAHEFQHSIQDNAVGAVFRSFDTPDGIDEVRKKDVCRVLAQENLRQCLNNTFPGLRLERVVADLQQDGEQTISFDEFSQVLRHAGVNAAGNPDSGRRNTLPLGTPAAPKTASRISEGRLTVQE
jgi:serine/threonine protein kinase